MSGKSYQLQTLSRALDVLSMIETSPGALTMTEIAEKQGESAPVVFRMLKTLEAKGYIHRVGETKKYRVSDAHDRLGTARLLLRVIQSLIGKAPQSGNQLAERLSADANSTALVLNLLRETRFAAVTFDGDWSLSPHLVESRRSSSIEELREVVRPVMEHLHELTGESLILHVRNGSLLVAVDVISSRHPLRYTVDIGSVFPVNRGAAGKASIAWLGEEEVRRLLADPALAGEKIKINALLEELKETRRRGFGISFGERIEGTAAVSVAIMDSVGEPCAAIAVSGPQARCPLDILLEYGALTRAELKKAGLSCPGDNL